MDGKRLSGALSAAVGGLLLAATLHIAAMPLPAQAGAWMLAPGEGQAIVTGTFTKGSRYVDALGRSLPVADYEKFELTSLVEYGLTERFTVFVKPSYNRVEIGPPDQAGYSGPGQSEIGARRRLPPSGPWVRSAQISAFFPGTAGRTDPAKAGNTDGAVDLRLLTGRGFDLFGWSSFVDAQGAARISLGDDPHEIRLDFTLGTRPHPRLLLLAQSFSTLGGGWALGVADAHSHKLQKSLVFDLTDDWSVQLGAVATVAGRETLRERGLLAAVWRRF